jgi:hypothetical protein
MILVSGFGPFRRYPRCPPDFRNTIGVYTSYPPGKMWRQNRFASMTPFNLAILATGFFIPCCKMLIEFIDKGSCVALTKDDL